MRMRGSGVRFLPAGALALAALSACGPSHGEIEETAAELFQIEAGHGHVTRVVLEPAAIETLRIETGKVAGGVGGSTLPYSALVYGPDGSTFVYTNPEANTYDRQSVTVDHIAGDEVYVSAGPAPDTPVVTQGAAELTGMEFGLEDE